MILGLSHDTCRWCGGIFKMKKSLRLYHHGRPSRPCSGAGEYGMSAYGYMLPHIEREAKARIAALMNDRSGDEEA